MAQLEYQLPRLTRMWTHLERQAGGLVKGMGEKQIEVDKRILRTQVCFLLLYVLGKSFCHFLRWLVGEYFCIVYCSLINCRVFTQIAQLKKQLETVRGHRQQYRDRRAAVPIPVVSLVRRSKHALIFHVSEFDLACAVEHEFVFNSFLIFSCKCFSSAHPLRLRWSRDTKRV